MDDLPETLKPEDARELIATGPARVLDLRDEDEYAEGHVPAAERAGDLEASLEGVPEDEPLILICADGKRSGQAARELREKGRQAAHVDGGIEAWIGAGLPIQPRPDEEFEGPKKAMLY